MQSPNADTQGRAAVVASSRLLPERMPWPAAIILIAALVGGLWMAIFAGIRMLIG